ncbi:MAG: Uracil-DNA glycosylase [Chlamydiae bacterium]|nr:Uracil-DNA glycosylase [Chlamydiota bacterium]
MRLHKEWHALLKEEIGSPHISELKTFLEKERMGPAPIYPMAPQVFQAFAHTPPEKVKVVIMGQDPYHGPGQAHGLSFSVPEGVPPPPSLKNIFKEIEADLGIPLGKTGCLIPWAKQGVLLLNATLTVREGQPKSHFGRGWESFTDSVVKKLAEREKPLIFLLWGRSAKDKCAHLLERSHHLVLTAAHPSPLSVHNGFFGCRHFSKVNETLKSWGETPVDWVLD